MSDTPRARAERLLAAENQLHALIAEIEESGKDQDVLPRLRHRAAEIADFKSKILKGN
jgi:hypothetical protein